VTVFPPFLGVQINNPTGLSVSDLAKHEALDDYMMVFESNFHPIVGQQVTLTPSNAATAVPRIALLLARANADECEVVAHDDKEGFLFNGSVFKRDRSNKPALTPAQLRARGTVTYTCVPKGNGRRLGIDRDLDGTLDGDE
jgi:hypothetical protein